MGGHVRLAVLKEGSRKSRSADSSRGRHDDGIVDGGRASGRPQANREAKCAGTAALRRVPHRCGEERRTFAGTFRCHRRAELKMVREIRTNPEPAALVHKNMRNGAMGAAGIPIPDQTTIDGLVQALAVESTGATEWSVSRSPAGVTASILREVPSSKCDVEAYRLIALARWRPRRVRFQWLGHRRHSAEILLLPWMERPGSFCSGRQRSDGQRKTA